MQIKSLVDVVTVEQLRTYLKNTGVIRKFANRYDLVYFGTVHADDEARIVRGMTRSISQRDANYLVGTAHDRDVIFLQRSDTLRAANQKKKEVYNWNILMIDLHNVLLPHVFLGGRTRYGAAFREAVAIKERDLVDLPYGFLSGYDPVYGERFSTRISAASSNMFSSLLPPERAAVLAHHFDMFDYEWYDDTLYVYFLANRPTMQQLEKMLKAGIWLANEIDNPTSCEVLD